MFPDSSYPNEVPSTLLADTPTLLLTAESDDRVSPAHAFKFVAALQEATAGLDGAHPVLLAVQSKAGHGAEKPTAQIIEQSSLILTFLAQTLHLSIADDGPPRATPLLPLTGDREGRDS